MCLVSCKRRLRIPALSQERLAALENSTKNMDDDSVLITAGDLEVLLESMADTIRKYVDARFAGTPPTRADENVIVQMRSEMRQMQRQIINLEASAEAHRKHLANLETKLAKLRRGEE